MPTSPRPAETDAGVGRRTGDPSSTSVAEPVNQPKLRAYTVSNETGADRNRDTVAPTTRAQPTRRHRRSSHGAAAVAAAATTATPSDVGYSSSLSGPRASSCSSRARSGSGASMGSAAATSATATTTARATVPRSRNRRVTTAAMIPPKKASV